VRLNPRQRAIQFGSGHANQMHHRKYQITFWAIKAIAGFIGIGGFVVG
jgi:hypothetical protein